MNDIGDFLKDFKKHKFLFTLIWAVNIIHKLHYLYIIDQKQTTHLNDIICYKKALWQKIYNNLNVQLFKE